VLREVEEVPLERTKEGETNEADLFLPFLSPPSLPSPPSNRIRKKGRAQQQKEQVNTFIKQTEGYRTFLRKKQMAMESLWEPRTREERRRERRRRRKLVFRVF